MIDIYTEIRTRYGNVKRARGYYLYTEKNVRLLDLYLDSGMSILGRKTGQINLAAKQFFDRGLTCFLPTKIEYQLEKAIKTLLPNYPVIRWYTSSEKACHILCSEYSFFQPNSLPIWRPFLPEDTADAVLIQPPYPSPYGFIAARGENNALPPSDALFPPLAWSIARSFFDLQKKQKPINTVKIVTNANRKKVNKITQQRHVLENLLSSLWEKRACYLFSKLDERRYTTLFHAALDAHILLSPSHHIPSILPELSCYTECVTFLQRYLNTKMHQATQSE